MKKHCVKHKEKAHLQPKIAKVKERLLRYRFPIDSQFCCSQVYDPLRVECVWNTDGNYGIDAKKEHRFVLK